MASFCWYQAPRISYGLWRCLRFFEGCGSQSGSLQYLYSQLWGFSTCCKPMAQWQSSHAKFSLSQCSEHLHLQVQSPHHGTFRCRHLLLQLLMGWWSTLHNTQFLELQNYKALEQCQWKSMDKYMWEIGTTLFNCSQLLHCHSIQ